MILTILLCLYFIVNLCIVTCLVMESIRDPKFQVLGLCEETLQISDCILIVIIVLCLGLPLVVLVYREDAERIESVNNPFRPFMIGDWVKFSLDPSSARHFYYDRKYKRFTDSDGDTVDFHRALDYCFPMSVFRPHDLLDSLVKFRVFGEQVGIDINSDEFMEQFTEYYTKSYGEK